MMNLWIIGVVVLFIVICSYFHTFRVVRIIVIDENKKNIYSEIDVYSGSEGTKVIKFSNSNNNDNFLLIVTSGFIGKDDDEGLFKVTCFLKNNFEILFFKNDVLTNPRNSKINTRYQKVKVININSDTC